MAIKTTRWRPGTCACVIDYTWDDTVPEAQRVHTQSRATLCADHASDGATGHFERVVEEHSRIARCLERIEANHPAFAANFLDRVTFAGRTVDGKRRLVISLPDLSAAQRATLQTWADGRFGPGRVWVSA